MTSSTPRRFPEHRVSPYTVVVADDNHHFRAGMVRALGNRDDFTVLAQVEDGAAAFDAISRLRPDVALVDARMPVLDGFALTARVKADAACGDVTVVVLSARTDDAAAIRAQTVGANAYLDKTQPRRSIVDAVLAAIGRTGAP